MTDKTLKHIIVTTIALLLIFQVGSLISGLFGMVWGAAAALIVALVSFFSTRLAKAGAQGTLWFLLPTVVFIIIPIGYKIWKLLTEETSGLNRTIEFVPFIIGFAAPVILLLLVYFELRKRTGHN